MLQAIAFLAVLFCYQAISLVENWVAGIDESNS